MKSYTEKKKACRDYGCRHKKHGYTKKDHPAPRMKVKPARKTDEEIKALAQHHVCWCNTKPKVADAAS